VARWSPPAAALLPASALVGVVGATTGAGGALLSPLVVSATGGGLPYIATAASCAVLLHVGRVGGYAAAGRLDGSTVAWSALLVVCLLTGNLLGLRLRARLTPALARRIELTALVVAAALALAGLARGR
jgi:uncharacterized membrane protein YfcA